MLCILAVFVSAFFMQGAARNLFVPLALAVGFAIVASYVLSTTLVPVLLIWVLRTGHDHAATEPSRFDRFRNRYPNFSALVVRRRWLIVPGYLVVAITDHCSVWRYSGRAIFPTVDAGQLIVRLRAQTGTRIEETERLANKTLDIIRREVGANNLELSVGVQNAAYPVNTILLRGQAALRRPVSEGVAQSGSRIRLPMGKLPKELPGVRFSFEPSDIISRVMSFGAPTTASRGVRGP